MSTVSDSLFRFLSLQGVDHIFLIPGDDPSMHIAIDKHTKPVIMRDERAAAFAAQIYGRLKGLGACATSHGPGMSNLTTGLAAAYLEHDSVVAISSQLVPAARKPFNHAYIFEDILKPVTKRLKLLSDPTSAVAEAAELIEAAQAHPQGPVALVIPQDVSKADCGAHVNTSCKTPKADAQKVDTDEGKFNLLESKVNHARHILAVIGAAVIREKAVDEVRSFLQKFSAFSVTTIMAKGVTGRDDELTVSRHNLATISKDLDFDLCLMIGVDLSEGLAPPSTNAEIININSDQSPCTVSVQGALKDLLKRLSGCCEGKEPWRNQAEFIRPPTHLVEKAASESSAFNGVICVDTGLYKHAWATFCRSKNPLEVLITNGLSSIGWSIAAAIGAYFATGKRVLAVIGDGGFSMSISELYPVLQYKIPITILIIRDNSYGMIKRLELEHFGASSTLVEIVNCDYPSLAKAFGIDYVKVDSTNVKDCFSGNETTARILEMNVDYADYQFSHH